MDDLYKKMVLALPGDFFAGWQWQAGDRAIIPDGREVINIDSQLRQQMHAGNMIAAIFSESAYNEYDLFHLNDLRPVPTQKQLQSIIKQHWLKSDDTVKDYDVLVFFQDWFRARYGSNYTYGLRYKEIENESIDCIWLRYTMHVIYNKNWNGEVWI